MITHTLGKAQTINERVQAQQIKNMRINTLTYTHTKMNKSRLFSAHSAHLNDLMHTHGFKHALTHIYCAWIYKLASKRWSKCAHVCSTII